VVCQGQAERDCPTNGRRPGLHEVSSRRQDLLGNNGGTFAFDGLQAAGRRAKQAAAHKDILVLGADVARQLLRADLLDEIRVHLVPLLLGAGTPLFGGEQAQLVPEGKPVTGTVTHLHYRVQR
jgi:dihydrofolate reductase